MSKQYIPRTPFTVPIQHLPCTVKKVNGVNKPTFAEGKTSFCSAVSYGGTEKVVNDVVVIEDTWLIDMWYAPDYKKGDHIRFLDDGSEFEVLASPENINRRGQYMRFKVRHIGG